MNFTFMLILILTIITFITYKSTIDKKYVFIAIVCILVLNEIYNFKENFTYRLSVNDLKINIPEVNNNIRTALECKKEYYLKKQEQQVGILQRMRHYLFDNNLYNIFKQTELPLTNNDIKIDMEDSVFNTIPTLSNPCGEVCHLIDEKDKCDANTKCEWFGDTNNEECRQNCIFYSRKSCDLQPHCIFNTDANTNSCVSRN